MSHTPGPWNAGRDLNGDLGVFAGEPPEGTEVLRDDMRPLAERQANAELMAKSPEMLEVCKAAYLLLRNLIDTESYGPTDDSDPADFPCDKDGDPWYQDAWELSEALKKVSSLIRIGGE